MDTKNTNVIVDSSGRLNYNGYRPNNRKRKSDHDDAFNRTAKLLKLTHELYGQLNDTSVPKVNDCIKEYIHYLHHRITEFCTEQYLNNPNNLITTHSTTNNTKKTTDIETTNKTKGDTVPDSSNSANTMFTGEHSLKTLNSALHGKPLLRSAFSMPNSKLTNILNSLYIPVPKKQTENITNRLEELPSNIISDIIGKINVFEGFGLIRTNKYFNNIFWDNIKLIKPLKNRHIWLLPKVFFKLLEVHCKFHNAPGLSKIETLYLPISHSTLITQYKWPSDNLRFTYIHELLPLFVNLEVLRLEYITGKKAHTIHNVAISHTHFKYIKQCKRLKELYIAIQDFDNSSLDSLLLEDVEDRIAYYTGLKKKTRSDAIVKSMNNSTKDSNNSSVITYDLGFNNKRNICFPNLVRLYIHGKVSTFIGGEDDFVSMSTLQYYTQLEYLQFRIHRINPNTIKCSIHHTSLNALYGSKETLRGLSIGPVMIPAGVENTCLEGLLRFTKLEKLSLGLVNQDSNSKPTSLALEPITKNFNLNLKSLKIENCLFCTSVCTDKNGLPLNDYNIINNEEEYINQIGHDKILKFINGNSTFSNLYKLHLFCVDGFSWLSMAVVVSSKTLSILKLSFCDLKDRDMAPLSVMKPTLKSVEFNSCINLTDQTLRYISTLDTIEEITLNNMFWCTGFGILELINIKSLNFVSIENCSNIIIGASELLRKTHDAIWPKNNVKIDHKITFVGKTDIEYLIIDNNIGKIRELQGSEKNKLEKYRYYKNVLQIQLLEKKASLLESIIKTRISKENLKNNIGCSEDSISMVESMLNNEYTVLSCFISEVTGFIMGKRDGIILQ